MPALSEAEGSSDVAKLIPNLAPGLSCFYPEKTLVPALKPGL